ncbi:MAG: RecX family transcriptional regulator [Patescibacteria group bacterium]
MPVITAIKPQKSKKRVNIYLDYKFGFGIDLENFTRMRLRVEMELTQKEIEEIVKKSEFQKTLDKLLRFATLRPRSEKEVKDWFRRRTVHESLHEELFNRLKRLDLIDDMRFTQWWIEQRTSFKPRGKRALEAELRNKGIKKEIISEVLEETEVDEEKMARELLGKKAYRWKNLSKLEARQKMGAFLARKGFNWEIIEKVLNKL